VLELEELQAHMVHHPCSIDENPKIKNSMCYFVFHVLIVMSLVLLAYQVLQPSSLPAHATYTVQFGYLTIFFFLFNYLFKHLKIVLGLKLRSTSNLALLFCQSYIKLIHIYYTWLYIYINYTFNLNATFTTKCIISNCIWFLKI
jgi:hypothetical protein